MNADEQKADPKSITDSDSRISLNEAADRLGLHYMTVYRYVRTGRLYATKAQGQWWVETSDVDELQAPVVDGHHADGDLSPARANLVEPFTTRLLAGDAGGCWSIITDALASGASPADVHLLLLQPALVTIGQRWADDLIPISAEHRATATALRLLGRLGPLFVHPGRRRGTVVLAMVAGDHHSMPSAMLADLLTDEHLDVIDLGANTPSEAIIETAKRSGDLRAIGVAATVDSLAPVLVETARELRSALPDAHLVAGGPVAVTCSAQLEAYVDAVGTNALESAKLIAGVEHSVSS